MNKRSILSILTIVIFSLTLESLCSAPQSNTCGCPCTDLTNPSCQTENQLMRLDQVHFGAPVRTVSWIIPDSCGSRFQPVIAAAIIGGQPVSTSNGTYDFQLYGLTNSQTLEFIDQGNHGGTVLASASWVCPLGAFQEPYIAVAGVANAEGYEVEIFDANLTRIAYFTHGATIHAMSVLTSCNAIYIAIGGEASSIDQADFRILRVPQEGGELVPVVSKVHGAPVFSVDWCTQTDCPLLAVGGKTSAIECGINIRVFSFDCTTTAEALRPYAEQAFQSPVVNSVKWCCGTNKCITNPLLAVGGQKAADGTNIRIYYVSATTHDLVQYASTATNNLPQIYAVDWNPKCPCTNITAGGGCLTDMSNCNPNIIVYNVNAPNLQAQDNEQFDTNITSLAWFAPQTKVISLCSYLLVGSENPQGYAEDKDLNCNLSNSIEAVLYRAVFCRQVYPPILPNCQRN